MKHGRIEFVDGHSRGWYEFEINELQLIHAETADPERSAAILRLINKYQTILARM